MGITSYSITLTSYILFPSLFFRWFHPNLTRHHAEAELKHSEEGVYLLRPKMEGGRVVEGYALDIRFVFRYPQ